MRLVQCLSLETLREVPVPERTVLALGNFDGVHLAHRKLIEEATGLCARYPGAVSGVFCFRELSSERLSRNPPAHLCTAEERLERFRTCGAEIVLIADFDAIRELSPERFVRDLLQTECRCVAAVCGFNYRFGKGASGDAATLNRLLNGNATVCSAVTVDGKPVSSTRIRNLLAEGNVRDAATLLTEPYSVSTVIMHGKALGRKMGFPTVNQSFPERLSVPRFGVYATVCEVEGNCYRGVTNVGVRPTVDAPGSSPNCETYLIGFSGDLYGKRVKVSFLDFIRPERKFASVEELTAQIREDVRRAQQI